jgi:hypothetical protein
VSSNSRTSFFLNQRLDFYFQCLPLHFEHLDHLLASSLLLKLFSICFTQVSLAFSLSILLFIIAFLIIFGLSTLHNLFIFFHILLTSLSYTLIFFPHSLRISIFLLFQLSFGLRSLFHSIQNPLDLQLFYRLK